MNRNIRTAILWGVTFCGLNMQLVCHGQSAVSNSGNGVAPQTATNTAPAHADSIDLGASERPAANPGKASTIEAATRAAPTDPSTPATAPSTPAANSSAATAASIAIANRNDAVLKELAAMKKQFEQAAQTQALIKAQIEKLENELNTNPATGDSVSAETAAGALR